MPTKPSPVTDELPPWAGLGNYPAGVYSAALPWGAANPLAGTPLPWGGMPRLNAALFTSFCNSGYSPQVPTDASSQNEWDRRIGVWGNWVILGTDAPDADAHIMETTDLGLSRCVAYEATAGFQNAGPAPAEMLMGFNVPAGETSTFGDGCTIAGGAGVIVDVGDGFTVDTGDFAAITTGTGSTLTMPGGFVDLLTDSSRVFTGGVDFYTTAAPGPIDGLLQWDGRRLSIGISGTVVVVSAPYSVYVATATTAAAGTDIAGLNRTAIVAPTQDIFITVDAHQSVDAMNGSLLRIRATNGVDSVSQLRLGDDDAAVSVLPAQALANDRRPNSVRVQWRPTDDFPVPDNDTWTFFVQHGASGGDTVKTTAATLKLQFL